MEIGGQVYGVTARLSPVASLEDEWYDDVADPVQVVRAADARPPSAGPLHVLAADARRRAAPPLSLRVGELAALPVTDLRALVEEPDQSPRAQPDPQGGEDGRRGARGELRRCVRAGHDRDLQRDAGASEAAVLALRQGLRDGQAPVLALSASRAHDRRLPWPTSWSAS